MHLSTMMKPHGPDGRAQALNRWMEESLDQLTEVLVTLGRSRRDGPRLLTLVARWSQILAIDSISDAQNYLSELDSFKTPLASKEGELANLKSYHEEMSVAGTGASQYDRHGRAILVLAIVLARACLHTKRPHKAGTQGLCTNMPTAERCPRRQQPVLALQDRRRRRDDAAGVTSGA